MNDSNGNQQSATNKHTLIALVENRPGVLNRVVSLFRRRNFNLDSLTVGRTHKDHISRMTIVVDSAKSNARLIAANLTKLINVIEVRDVSAELYVSRDLALVKVLTDNAESYNAVTEICERYPARIVDMGSKYTIVEITAREDMVEEFIDAMRPIGIVEVVRTGVVAMGRGARILDSDYEPPVFATMQDSHERYSV